VGPLSPSATGSGKPPGVLDRHRAREARRLDVCVTRAVREWRAGTALRAEPISWIQIAGLPRAELRPYLGHTATPAAGRSADSEGRIQRESARRESTPENGPESRAARRRVR
jgi:hypothetical protein